MINCFYFFLVCGSVGFANNYLQYKGLDTSVIGVLLTSVSIIALIGQTTMAPIVDKSKVWNEKRFIIFSLLVASIAYIALIVIPGESILSMIVTVIGLAFATIGVPYLNSLAFIYEKEGYKINYGLGRGVGSAAYAVAALCLGQLIKLKDPSILPVWLLVMAIATIGAFALQEYTEGIAVMLFYQVGELFQSYAVNQSRKSVASLMDIRPDSAVVLRDGVEEEVFPDEVAVGETIIVKPGERIPLDGIVLEGSSMEDTKALTGEAVPRKVSVGDEIISGCINLTNILKIRTTKEYGESTVARILDLVENASSQKAKVENFITKFARYYTPIVVGLAAFIGLIVPIFLPGHPFAEWIYRALSFLVCSCPCALVISVPLSFFGGIGCASKNGVLVKGSNYLEAVSKAETMVFDKTGTLTKGTFRVTKLAPVEGSSESSLLLNTATAEQYSSHPIALSVLSAWKEKNGKELAKVEDAQEIAGKGLKVTAGGHVIHAGNQSLMAELGLTVPTPEEAATVVYTAVDGVYSGYLLISDEVKEDAKEAISRLHHVGVKKTVMLTGDRKAIGEYTAKLLDLDEVHTDLLPADKVSYVNDYCNKKTKGRMVCFVGDGINDAPVLARADVGIAMGGLGSDAAVEAADIVIMEDQPSKLADVIQIGRRTVQICNQNIVFAIAVKVIILALVAAGFANMWAAVFADVGVAVIAILNAMRTLYYKPQK